MMGTKERHFAPLINVSVEELVPSDHFYRHLERTLDLSFVREFVQETYAGKGRPSIDPIVFFKLQLIMFFEGIRSERLLMRHAADRLSVRWFLGYDLGEPLPDHSSLTRIRERYGVEVFLRFFEAIVEQCQQAGLVWGKELYVDATKVKANASLDSLKPRFAVEAHLANLFGAETEGAQEEGDQQVSLAEAPSSEPVEQKELPAPVPLPTSLSQEEQEQLAQQNAWRHDWIEEVGAQDRRVKSHNYQRIADYLVSSTDPDATTMHTSGGVDLGYHTHYVVDGGKARIILTVLVTPAEVMDEEYLDRVRVYHTTEAYKKAYRKRNVWVEPLFAEAKDWHGLRRFRLRLLWRVNCEASRIAAGQNLKRLLNKRGWGRRPFPVEALCAFFLAALGVVCSSCFGVCVCFLVS